MKTIQERIDEIVNNYATNIVKYDDLTKQLFRTELEALVAHAGLEAIKGLKL